MTALKHPVLGCRMPSLLQLCNLKVCVYNPSSAGMETCPTKFVEDCPAFGAAPLQRDGREEIATLRYATNDTEYSFFLSEQRVTSCGDTQFDKHNIHI
jgi:hypothetical protein